MRLALSVIAAAALLAPLGAQASADEAAIKAFVADIQALARKPIPAVDPSGKPIGAQSASIRRQGPMAFMFTIKSVRTSGKTAAPQMNAFSLSPKVNGLGAGTFMASRHYGAVSRTTPCSAKYAVSGARRTLDLTCTKANPAGGFTPGEVVSKIHWELAPQTFEVRFASADGTVNAIYRAAR